MSEEKRELTPEQLAEQEGLAEQEEATDLPERENMSLINANIAAPINAAVAANVLSDGAKAGAIATQDDPIKQGMLGG